jgi:hypothetical protein
MKAGLKKCTEMALLRHREINKISGPMKRDLRFLKRWMERVDMGNVYLHGKDNTTWSNEEWQYDLVSLKTRPADDLFYLWVYDVATHWYHKIMGRHTRVSDQEQKQLREVSKANQKPGSEEHLAGTVVYGEAIVLGSTRAIATLLACVLPVASIALLYIIQNMAKRLGIVAALTFLFSLSLVVMTSAGVADIFAATAAYETCSILPFSNLSDKNFIATQRFKLYSLEHRVRLTLLRKPIANEVVLQIPGERGLGP